MANLFNELFSADMAQYDGKRVNLYTKVFHFLHRKAQTRRNSFSRFCFKALFRLHSKKHGIEIPTCCKIGKGLYLGHVYNITINGDTVIGEKCHIHKGVTIGSEARGKRMGTPTIGNMVCIGINSAIVGRITIGDDVMIAPNSFINCDVPSHSVVFGNPCIIKHRENATEGYIM